MSKYTGKGGKAVKDDVALGQVGSYTWSESQGTARGSTHSDVTLDIFLDGEPIRVNDTFTLDLKTREGETNYIGCGVVKVDSVSVAVNQEDVMVQKLQVTGYQSAVYASIT